jgi:hypothetical protein
MTTVIIVAASETCWKAAQVKPDKRRLISGTSPKTLTWMPMG